MGLIRVFRQSHLGRKVFKRSVTHGDAPALQVFIGNSERIPSGGQLACLPPIA